MPVIFALPLGTDSPKFFLRCKYDVTDTLDALRKWNQENSTKLTLTHVALKALAVGIENA